MVQSPDHIRTAYDQASEAYARQFIRELEDKPKDRELLGRFVELSGKGNRVLDLGCGPGHTTHYLDSLGVCATGIDLSPGMIAQANKLFPESAYSQGDMLSLAAPTSSVGGVLAFYCIVHLDQDQLRTATSEMYRVLQPGGAALLSFHVGTGVVQVDGFLGTDANLEFRFFSIEQVREALVHSGFERIEMVVRDPYETEYPSTRGYVFAFRPE